MLEVPFSLIRLPLLEAALMGALAGMVGAIALVSRRVFFTESLTHSTFPGAVAGVVVAASLAQSLGHTATYSDLTDALFIGSFVMCLPMIGLMRWLTTLPGITSQAAAGIVLTVGFALGFFLAKWYAPLPLHVESFLVGSLLNVTPSDIVVTASVLSLAVLALVLLGRRIVFQSFDPIGYAATGMRPALPQLVVLVLICLTIAALVPAVGTILPIALIAGPSAALLPWFRSMKVFVLSSTVLGAMVCLSGTLVGVAWELSIGGTIAVLAGIVYAVSMALVGVRAWRVPKAVSIAGR